jgi:multiple sugar transport system substrate-binding protein
MKKMVALCVCLLLATLFASADPVEVSVWHYFSPADTVAFNKIVADFNASQSGVKVVAQLLSREELIKQYTIGLVGGSLPDIGMIDNPDHAAFSAMGLFLDLSDRVKGWEGDGKFFTGPWKSCIYQGKVYGVPQNSNCLAMFYNADMLKAAGVKVPTTWDELRTAAKKLTKNGVYGMAICAIGNETGTYQYLPWLLSTGATVEKLNSPEAIKSMSFLTGLVKEGSMSSEVINWTQSDVEKQFVTGRVAMMINGPWQIPTIKKDSPKFNWALAKVPRDKVSASVLGGENFGIISSSKHPNEAWEFITYLVQPKSIEEYCKISGKLPPRSDVMKSSSYWRTDPFLKVFGEQMETAMPRGPHPKWPDISQAIWTALQESLTMSKTPEQAMKDAQAKVEKVLAK